MLGILSHGPVSWEGRGWGRGVLGGLGRSCAPGAEGTQGRRAGSAFLASARCTPAVGLGSFLWPRITHLIATLLLQTALACVSCPALAHRWTAPFISTLKGNGPLEKAPERRKTKGIGDCRSGRITISKQRPAPRRLLKRIFTRVHEGVWELLSWSSQFARGLGLSPSRGHAL